MFRNSCIHTLNYATLCNTYSELNHVTLLNYVDRELSFLCVIHCHSRRFMSLHLTQSDNTRTTPHVQEVSSINQECGVGRLLDGVEVLKENTVKQNVRLLTHTHTGTTNINYTQQSIG